MARHKEFLRGGSRQTEEDASMEGGTGIAGRGVPRGVLAVAAGLARRTTGGPQENRYLGTYPQLSTSISK